MNNLACLLDTDLSQSSHVVSQGRIVSSRGSTLVAELPHAALGDLCYIKGLNSDIPAQVVAFSENNVTLAPLQSLTGIGTGVQVIGTGLPLSIKIPGTLLGKVVNALGDTLENVKQKTNSRKEFGSLNIYSSPPNPLKRKPITKQLITGVTALDTLCPLGYGQRLGLFASAGVGKSTLLGMLSRNAQVDVVVIGLIGERGREVKEFIDHNLGDEGLRKSVVVVSTSDEPPIMRTIAAYTATSIAEYYRDQGCNVLLLMDSITRTARAIRDVGLSAGELPVRHGYTTSVYTELPRLLERAGTSEKGSITAIYNILTDNERELDPLAEEIKSILDGHITLSRQIAEQGVQPAFDVVSSISRLMPALFDVEDQKSYRKILKIAAKLRRDKDILLLGGTPDPELKAALNVEGMINELIDQRPNERRELIESQQKVMKIIDRHDSSLLSVQQVKL